MKTLSVTACLLIHAGISLAEEVSLQCKLLPLSGSTMYCDIDKRFCTRAFRLDTLKKTVIELPDGFSSPATPQRVVMWNESYIEFSRIRSRQKWPTGKTAYVTEEITLLNRLDGEIQETILNKLSDGKIIDDEQAKSIVGALADKDTAPPQYSRRTGACRVIQKAF